MPVYQRKEIEILLGEIKQGKVHPVYLLHGERYLCRRVADRLITALKKERGEDQVNVKRLEGEKEDAVRIVNLLKSHSLFGGREIIRIMDCGLLSSGEKSPRAYWEQVVKARAVNNEKGMAWNLSRLLDLAGLDNPGDLNDFESAQWQKVFGFAKPGNLAWLNDIVIKEGQSSFAKTDQEQELITFLEKERSINNVLLMVSEEVDKRKKLYRVIGRKGAIVDFSTPAGENRSARKEKEAVIRELISGTLRQMGKKPGRTVLENLIERVGFHPVAAVLETEKLALYCDQKNVVEAVDVDAVVGRTREEAVFELNEAVAELDLTRSLLLVNRLMDQGFHPLAIVSSLRKTLRRFLYIRFLEEQPDSPYIPGQNYESFKAGYLNQLKNTRFAGSIFLKGHPYALYRSFTQAEKLSGSFLRKGLEELLRAEYRLKGSGVRGDLILEDFFFSFLTGQEGH